MPVITNAPYTLLINGEKSYPILREGFSLKLVAGADGKHRTSSCSVSVRGSSVLSDIMYAEGLVDAVVRDNAGNVLFTGVIRPSASVNVNQYHMDAIQLEVLDYTEKMHLRIYEKVEADIEYGDDVIFSQSWPDAKVCDPSDTENSVVHKICRMCGIEVAEAPSIPVALYGFELEYGSYLDDVLSTLLFEYVYDFDFDASGRMHVFQTGPIMDPSQKDVNGNPVIHDIPGTPTNLAGLRNKLSIRRSDDPKDGAVVTYPKYATTGDVELWSKSYGAYIFIAGGISTIADEWVSWNKSGLGDARKISLSGFWLGFNDTSSGAAGTSCVEKSLTGCTQSGGYVHCRANIWSIIFGKPGCRLSVHASARYLTNETRTVGFAGNNSENYSARYIQEPSYATSLANAIRTRFKYNNFSYTFDSFVELTPGEIVIIDEPNVSGVSAKVRITSREMTDETGLFHYEAEGYGTSEFSTPVLDRDDTPNLPQNEPDWMLLKVSDDLIVPDDSDTSPIIAEAYGAIFDKYGASPSWYLNNVLQPELTSMHIELSKTIFVPGSNVIKVAASYDGETYELSAVVKCFSPDLSISMQYAVLDEGEEPDGTTVWMSTQPDPGEGQIVWVRFRVSESAEWIVLRWTGENGGNPIIYFQWAATPYVRPDDGVDLMTWDTMAIVWECPDGSLMGFTAQTGAWSETVPDRPRGLNYLWVKYWNYKTKAWDFFCTTGTPAMSFDLVVNPQTFKLTSRGVVAAGTNGEDQRIIVHCLPVNSTAPASWELDDGTPEGQEPVVSWDEDWTGFNNLDRCIRISTGKALPSFTIRCSIADIDMAKEFVVSGIQEGKAEMTYLGVYESLEELSQVTSTPEGPLMVGDHAFVETDGHRVPYYWTGTAWAFADEDTPDHVENKMLMDMLNDALKSPDAIDSQSIINLFTARLASDKGFIRSLASQFFQLLDGGAIYSGGYDQTGDNPQGLPGVFIGADGRVFMVQATVNGSFECLDDAGIIMKTYFGLDGDSYPASSKTRWNSQDVCSAIAVGASGSCTYDGQSYSYFRGNSSNPFHFHDSGIWYPQGHTYSPQFPCTLRLQFYCKGGGLLGESWYVTYRGNTQRFDATGQTHTLTFEMNGTTDSVYVQASANGGGETDVWYIKDALFLYTNVQSPSVLFYNWHQANLKHLVCGGFDSDAHKRLASLNGWVSQLAIGGCIFSDSTKVKIDGVEYTPSTGVLSTNVFTLVTEEGETFSFQRLASEGGDQLEGQFYDIEGTLTLSEERRGMATASIYPSATDAVLGLDGRPYLSGYINSLFLAALTISGGTLRMENMPTSSGGLPKGAFYRDGSTVRIV